MAEPLLDPAAPRCFWVDSAPADYLAYHDTEWGYPVADDRRLFEKLCLEGFQSGLSWLTILRKRQNFRAAFAGFDLEAVARFTEDDVSRLLGDAGIVRHRGKIAATIGNARRALEVAAEFGSLAAYLWPHAVTDASAPLAPSDIPAETPGARLLSRDLKRRGFSFVGPTIVYSLMQAVGLVDDHAAGCTARPRAEAERATAMACLGPGRGGA